MFLGRSSGNAGTAALFSLEDAAGLPDMETVLAAILAHIPRDPRTLLLLQSHVGLRIHEVCVRLVLESLVDGIDLDALDRRGGTDRPTSGVLATSSRTDLVKCAEVVDTRGDHVPSEDDGGLESEVLPGFVSPDLVITLLNEDRRSAATKVEGRLGRSGAGAGTDVDERDGNVEELDRELSDLVRVMPEFTEHQSIYDWSYVNISDRVAGGLAAAMSCDLRKARALLRTALLVTLGLPRLRAMAIDSDIPVAWVEEVAQKVVRLEPAKVDAVDVEVASLIDGSTTHSEFARVLRDAMALVEIHEETADQVLAGRTVTHQVFPDGSGAVTFWGPAVETEACFARSWGMGTAVVTGQTDLLDGLGPGERVVESRTVGHVAFDMFSAWRPGGWFRVTSAQDARGTGVPGSMFSATAVQDSPDSGGSTGLSNGVCPTCGSRAAAEWNDRGAATAGGVRTRSPEAVEQGWSVPFDHVGVEAPACVETPAGVDPTSVPELRYLALPEVGALMREQMSFVVSVPMLSLTGVSDLPGRIDGRSPVPAAFARGLFAVEPSFSRVVTDAVDGAVLPSVARNYRITEAMRRAVAAAWVVCSFPGCTRRAASCDLDHKIPFDHEHPENGGPTSIRNLAPLCRRHHGMKTDRKVGMEVDLRAGTHRWVMPAGPFDRIGGRTGLEARPWRDGVAIRHSREFSDAIRDSATASEPARQSGPATASEPTREASSSDRTGREEDPPPF